MRPTFKMNVKGNNLSSPASCGMNNTLVCVIVFVYAVAHGVEMWNVYVHVLSF